MLTALIDDDLVSIIQRDIGDGLAALGLESVRWKVGEPVPVPGVDVVVTNRSGLEAVNRIFGASGNVRVVVVADAPTPSDTRVYIGGGADSVLDLSLSDRCALAWSIGSAAAGLDTLPAGHARVLTDRLDEPPPDLDSRDRELLAVLTDHTIEEAGRQLGLSRRQAQRRFKSLCGKYGFCNHLDAVVAATRWGVAGPMDPARRMFSEPEVTD